MVFKSLGLPGKATQKTRSQKEKNRQRERIVHQSHEEVEIIELDDLGPMIDMQDDEQLRGPRRVSQEDMTTQ